MKRPADPPRNPFPSLYEVTPTSLKSTEQFWRGVNDAQSEVLGFLGRRFDADARTLHAFSACRTWDEIFTVQQKWFDAARADYADEAGRMTRINRAILESLSGAPAAAARPEGGPTADNEAAE